MGLPASIEEFLEIESDMAGKTIMEDAGELARQNRIKKLQEASE